jgi:hypothetical protein
MPIATIVIVATDTDDINNSCGYCEYIVSIPIDSVYI